MNCNFIFEGYYAEYFTVKFINFSPKPQTVIFLPINFYWILYYFHALFFLKIWSFT